MPVHYPMKFTSRMTHALVPLALLGASASAAEESANIDRSADPMRFFEGRTEGISTIKIFTRKPFRSRTLGKGEIGADGVLTLVQRVIEDGKAPYDRRWKMRQVAPGRFAGTMTEASGPVVVDEVGGPFRFRFRMKGNVAIEQWLTPLPDGKTANSKISIRKFGMVVGRSEGMIRKL